MPILCYGGDLGGFGNVNGITKTDTFALGGLGAVGFRGDKYEHPCPKPINVMLWAIQRNTLDNSVVLDPFCGSGSTGVACLRLGRRFIGIEKDATYAALAVERLEAESRGMTLASARAGQLSLLDAGAT
jgi:hypothetical protein